MKIYVFCWDTKSGDNGIGPYWSKKPTGAQIKKLIHNNPMLLDEQKAGCLHYCVDEIEEAK